MTTSKYFTLQIHCVFFALIASATLVSGCSSGWSKVAQHAGGADTHTTDVGEYNWDRTPSEVTAPGYLVELISPDPKVNGEFRIEMDRTLKLPYDVTVSTAELSESELEKEIRQSYVKYFKSAGSLEAKVIAKEYLLDVQGLVRKPGYYAVRQNASIDEIIAKAGGLDQSGESDRVRYLQIQGPSGTGIIRLADYHSGSKAITPSWRGGESLFFQTQGLDSESNPDLRKTTVRVIGQVKNPAEFPAAADATFFTYLIKAGGPTDRADLGNVTLIRGNGSGTKALAINTLDFDNIPAIEPGDTVIINADNPTPVEKKSRIGANLASILTSIGIVIIAGM